MNSLENNEITFEETLERVKDFLRIHNSENQPFSLDNTTATAQQAADVLGVKVCQIGKTIAFKCLKEGVDMHTVVVVLSGDKRVDTLKLANDLKIDKVKSLSADEVVSRTGFRVGGVCPFSLPNDVLIIVDRELYDLGVCYVAAGHPFAVVKTCGEEIVKITKAKIWGDEGYQFP